MQLAEKIKGLRRAKSLRISILVIFLALAVIALPRVRFDSTIENWVPPNSLIADEYHDFLETFPSDAFLFLSIPLAGDSISEALETKVSTFIDSIHTLPDLLDVSRWPLRGIRYKHKAGETLWTLLITFKTPSHLNPDNPEFIRAVRKHADQLGLTYHLAGTGVLTEATVREAQITMGRYLVFSILILIVLLMLTLRRWQLVLKVLAVSVGGLMSMFIILGLFNIPFYVEQTILPVLILVYGTSSSLHLIFHGNQPQVKIPCGLAILTTVVGFSVFIASPIPLLQHFAWMALSGLGGGFLSLLLIFPEEFEVPRHLEQIKARVGGFKLPPRSIVFGFALIVFGISLPGLLKIESHIDSLGVIDPASPAVQDHLFIERNIGARCPLEFTVDLKTSRSTTIRRWMNEIYQLPQVSGVISYQSFRPLFDPVEHGYQSQDRLKGRITFFIPLLNTSQGKELLQKIQAITDNHFEDDQPEANGYMMLYLSVVDALKESFASSILLALIIISLILVIFIRDTWMIIAALIVNVIPVSLILGLMGWMDMPLDLVTVPIGCLLLSVIVDDTLHFLFWLKQDNRIAFALGAAGPGAILTSLVMAAGFSVFLLSPIPPMRNFGILMIAAMTSAIFSDLILLPLLLKSFKKAV